jgi:GNAT superfamily N-acetyltransferase
LVGADWQWVDKLPWTEAQWREWVETDCLRTFVGFHEGAIAGYYELRRDDDGDQEIAIFGLAPEFVGRGLGGALLTHALQEGLRTAARRVWLHTCDLDHPSALPNYRARGMTVFKVEG